MKTGRRKGHTLMSYRGFVSRCQGASHVESGTVCQDAAEFYARQKLGICVVSDGHGSERHFRSNIGSEIAVNIAIRAVKQFVQKIQYGKGITDANHAKILRDLAGYIVSRWVECVKTHYYENPCTENENVIYGKHYKEDNPNLTKIYGATLIIGVLLENCAFILQNGDGAAFVVEQRGDAHVPSSTINEELFAGTTTSLSSSNCLEDFRYYYTDRSPTAIIVASDGIVDSYSGNNGNDFLVFCRKTLELYNEDANQAQIFIDDWLPQLSQQGSRDDMSIAGVYLRETC